MRSRHTLHYRMLAALYGLMGCDVLIEAGHPIGAGLYVIAACIAWLAAIEA